MINESFKSGQWPDVFKIEAVTPIPKVHPPINIDDLRNISGLKNLNKVAEKIVSRMVMQIVLFKLAKANLNASVCLLHFY